MSKEDRVPDRVPDQRAAFASIVASTALADEVEFLALKAFAEGTRIVNLRLKELNLRARSYSVLAVACSGVNATQRELASLLELDPSQIVALVDELENAGLVIREIDTRDHRSRVVRATANGQDRFTQARVVTNQAESDALRMLDSAERETLRALLRKIVLSDTPATDTPATEPPGGDATLLYLIKQVELAVRSHLEQAVGRAGLTVLQYTALTVLERHPEMTSSELARNSFVRPQTMAQTIAALEDLGYVERERDPRSQRQLLITLSGVGQRTLDDLRQPVADIESAMVDPLDQAQVASLKRALQLCRAALTRTRH
jgi:DNA-binding MarR family transcriptional regulator